MEEREVLRLLDLQLQPDGHCPLNAPLTIAMTYQLLEAVPAATWELVYEADFTNKKHAVPIYSTAAVDLAPGTHTFAHAVDAVKTDGIKEKYLLQVGLLKLTLKGANGTENITSVNMVTQVSKDPATGVLLRNIMTPLE
jgi:hypothetical protein